MSMKDFLREMDEAGKKFDTGGGVGCVGRILVEFGFHGYPREKGSGLDYWFAWRPASGLDDLERAKNDCAAKLTEHNVNAQARFGIKVTVFKDALTGPYSRDLAEFIAQWQVEGYKLLMDTLDENDIPTGQVFWGQTAQKANPFNVAKGDAGKTDTDQNGNPAFPTIRMPVRVFKDEQAARDFMNTTGSTSTSISWSEVAQAAFPNGGPNEALQAEILKWYGEAKKGKPYANDAKAYAGLPEHPTEDEAKEYISSIYDGIEVEDINTIEETLVH